MADPLFLIQPVWLEIENGTSEPVLLFPYSVDPDYFPPLEVAYLSHRIRAPKTNWRIDRFVYEQSFPQIFPAGATESGFVFTNLDKGAKYVPVDLFFERHIEGLEFFVSIPGFRADHTAVDFEVLWQEAQKTVLSTKVEVRERLPGWPSSWCRIDRWSNPRRFSRDSSTRSIWRPKGSTSFDIHQRKPPMMVALLGWRGEPGARELVKDPEIG